MSGMIQWTPLNQTSVLDVNVVDNDGGAAGVFASDKDFKVQVSWTIPPLIGPLLGGQFRLRAFAECMGPGSDVQIGSTVLVPVTATSTEIVVPAGTLAGEGAAVPSNTGVYRIIAVIQHLNPGADTVSGYAEGPLIQIRMP